MSKLIKELTKTVYKRYLVEAHEEIPFEGNINKGIVFTTDDRDELVSYLALMPSEYDRDIISVFDCDARSFITEEFKIDFIKREPRTNTEESSFSPELWRKPMEEFLNHPSIFNSKKL